MRSVHRPAVLWAAGLLGLVAAPFTVASSDHDHEHDHEQGTVIVACANNNGTLRQVSSPEECKRNETLVQWNIVGPQGPMGPKGVTGATGATGATGPTGTAGTTGAQGPAGLQGAKGDPGPQGVAGPTGETGVAGPQGAKGDQGQEGAAGTGFRWRGEFVPGAQYLTNDVVSYNGSAWIAIAPNLKEFPGASSHWNMLAQQGVEGAQGPIGLRGPQGAQGPAGQFVHGFREYWTANVTDTFVVPPGVTQIQVELWGGGGGGGTLDSYAAGGGGGGGGYFRGVISVVPGETLWTWVARPGWGGYCDGAWHNAGSGEDTAVWSSDDEFVKAGGGEPGGNGTGTIAGAGGAGGACVHGGSSLNSSLCRQGSWGATGGPLAALVPGGRTPHGSVSLPYGDGGGSGGNRWICDSGQTGNTGYILISW